MRKLACSLGAVALVGIAACGDGRIGDAPSDTEANTGAGTFSPAPVQMRRLLARQYVSSIRHMLGDAAAIAATPPHDPQINGFKTIAASQFTMTDPLVRDYERSARAVSIAAMTNSARIADLMGCTPSGDDDTSCLTSFIDRFGRLAFRRPLVDEERADYLKLAQRAIATLDEFSYGIEFVIHAMLQSPNFLYQVELGVGATDPSAEDETDGEAVTAKKHVRLDSYELASRMSFFLTDTTPSEELLDAAHDGELDTTDGVRTWAQRLLAQPEARTALQAFFSEYFVLDGLETLAKDPVQYAEFSPELARSMKLETLKLIEDIVFDREAPASEILTADYTFVDRELALFYGVQAPPPEVTWTKAALPLEQKRVGVLSHASILSRQAHSDSTSATYRGLFILERFLCRTMPPPPDDVVTELPPSSEAPTLRERIGVHLEDPVCYACHSASDPLGLALENYDGIGRYRDKENGASIDPSGSVENVGSFDGPGELAHLLASRNEVMHCMLRNVFRHATGHVEVSGEQPALRELEESFRDNAYNFKSLLVDMTASELFRTVGVVEE